MSNVTSIENAIRKAFEELCCPERGQIVSHGCPECLEVEETFVGRHWQDIPLEPASFLWDHCNDLSLMTPLAYQFYIPAWMLSTVLFFKRSGHIETVAVSSFSRPEEVDMHEWYETRMKQLSAVQRDAARGFLQFVALDEMAPGEPSPGAEEAQKALRDLVAFDT